MGLPHANAVLTKITRPASADDWDDPEVAGPTLWEGTADAYIRDRKRMEVSDGRTDLIPVRLITLPAEIAVSVGDTLHLVWALPTGDQLLELPVRAVTTHAAPPGIPGLSVAESEPT